jgi:hypothetical protein
LTEILEVRLEDEIGVIAIAKIGGANPDNLVALSAPWALQQALAPGSYIIEQCGLKDRKRTRQAKGLISP